MLERKRAAKSFHSVADDEETALTEMDNVSGTRDSGGQENGIVTVGHVGQKSVEQQVEEWDENANEEWDEAEPAQDHGDAELGKSIDADAVDGRKRDD